ncbi:hypothetical protein [Nostoc sp. DSM 114159]
MLKFSQMRDRIISDRSRVRSRPLLQQYDLRLSRTNFGHQCYNIKP